MHVDRPFIPLCMARERHLWMLGNVGFGLDEWEHLLEVVDQSTNDIIDEAFLHLFMAIYIPLY